jgi:SAM-dependent methyltransferase
LNAPNNWYEHFFSGLAVDFWRAAMTDDTTQAEADFFQEHLRLAPGSRVLDVPCGDGRLSLALAERGCAMTGVDISAEFLEAAEKSASERELPIALRRSDMRDLPWSAQFDAAFCAGNSFGFFDDEGNRAYIEAVARSLKPAGWFALDTGWVAEALFPHFREKIEMELGAIRFLAENRYEPRTGRVENRFTISRGKESESKLASHRVYSGVELTGLLEEAGLEPVEMFGSLTEEPFRLGSRRLLIVAQKRGRIPSSRAPRAAASVPTRRG